MKSSHSPCGCSGGGKRLWAGWVFSDQEPSSEWRPSILPRGCFGFLKGEACRGPNVKELRLPPPPQPTPCPRVPAVSPCRQPGWLGCKGQWWLQGRAGLV